MHCNGKCHLRKQLEKEDKKQGSNPASLKEKSELQFCSAPHAMTLQVTIKEVVPHFTYLFPHSESPALSVFHPPSADGNRITFG